jgi:fibronectin type III domain protein
VSDFGADAREAFTGKRGKVLIVVGVAAVGYLWWTRARHGGGASDADVAQAAADGYDAGVSAPQSPPTVGNDTQGDAGGSSGAGRPRDNAEWLRRGVDYLGTGATAYTALSKALGGQQLTQAEADMVSRVIQWQGSPPEGMPPLNTTAPKPTGPLPAPTGLKVVSTTKTTVTLDWNPVTGADYYRVYRKGVTTNIGGITPPGPITVGGLGSGKTYEFRVAAVLGQTHGAYSGYVKATTKK